ncbi:MAG: hypothetical protein GWO22_39630, partial [Actinobacteria bacterium]|nr:hypothetical protein [Actinomycetota bacterium]
LIGTGIYGRRRKKAGKPIIPESVTGLLGLVGKLLPTAAPATSTRRKK